MRPARGARSGSWGASPRRARGGGGWAGVEALATALEAEAAALGAGPRPEAGREPRSDAPPPCGACLGLRQPGEWLGWGWPGRLEAALGGGGDVGDPVQLALVLPPALAVRQAALARWARAHGVRGARAPGLPELRAEVGRALAALVPGARPPVGGGAGAGAGPSARVVLLVEAQHRGTRAEWVPVAPPAGTGGGRGRRGRGRKRGPPGGTAGTGPPPAEREAEAARLWAAAGKQLRALDGAGGGAQAPPGWAGWPDPLGAAWAVAEPAWLAAQPASPPVFIAGRYKKFERSLSQTPWRPAGGVRLSSEGGGEGRGTGPEARGEAESEAEAAGSVEAVLARVLCPAAGARTLTLHSAGREDRGVRMLGRGRPFVVEIRAPLRPRVPETALAAAARAAEAIGVGVDGLRCVDGKRAVAALAEGATEKQKLYTAVVRASRPLTAADEVRAAAAKDLVLQQGTPVRVLHRRSPLVRERVVHWLALERVPGCPRFAVLRLGAQAGTYIKEFVHGDFGRTRPDLGEFLGGGCRADILQLDVTDILMDFDPPAAGGRGAPSPAATGAAG